MISTRLIQALCLWSVHTAAEEMGSSARYWRRQAPRAMSVCQMVATRAQKWGLDPVEVIAVSYVETRHNADLVSSAGAVGPLQALPKYWRRKRDRDDVAAGLRAWAYYRGKSADARGAAGRYNGGGRNSVYALQVEAHIDQLRMIERVARWPL
jgi:soluble lytic murein transglycosylase-like protein